MAWRYQPRDNDNDTSVTGWGIAAVIAGRDFGLRIHSDALEMAGVWIQQVTSRQGRAGYSKRGEPPQRESRELAEQFPPAASESLTAIALASVLQLGSVSVESSLVQRRADLLLAKLPAWRAPPDSGNDLYYWFFASQALRAVGGKPWQQWQAALQSALLGAQRTDGGAAGSWDPVCAWGSIGGRVYSTALAILALQSEYRFGAPETMVMVPETAAFRAVRSAWQKRRFAQVVKQLDALDLETLSVLERRAQAILRGVIARREGRASSEVSGAIRGPNYYAASLVLKRVAKEFAGMQAGKDAVAGQQRFKKSKNIQREIAAGKLVHKALARNPVAKAARHPALRKALQAVIKKYGGSNAADEAKRVIESLDRR